MRRTSRLGTWPEDPGHPTRLAGRGRYFNRLALAGGLIVCAGLAQAEVSPPTAMGKGADEPVFELEAPDGHCVLESKAADGAPAATGFEPGLKSGTVLMAFYVPCDRLEAVAAGRADWFPEWVAIEKNTVTFPSDDTRSLGAHGAVRQLCADAQSAQWGHPQNGGRDLSVMVTDAHARLSLEKPVVFLGVIGEEEHACYLAALQLDYSPSGQPERFLMVTAFMQAGDRWVTQSVRRAAPASAGTEPGRDPSDIYEVSRKAARSFTEKNR